MHMTYEFQIGRGHSILRIFLGTPIENTNKLFWVNIQLDFFLNNSYAQTASIPIFINLFKQSRRKNHKYDYDIE